MYGDTYSKSMDQPDKIARHTRRESNQEIILNFSTVTNNSLVGVGKRGAYYLAHGNLPRQHSFGTTLRFSGPVPVDSRQ